MKDSRATCLPCLLRQLAVSCRPLPHNSLLAIHHSPALGFDDGSPRGHASYSKFSGGAQPSKPAWSSLISSTSASPPSSFSKKTSRVAGVGTKDSSSTIALFQEIVNDQKAINDRKDEPGGDKLALCPALVSLDTDLYGQISELKLKLKKPDWDPEDVIGTILDTLIPRLLKSHLESVSILKGIVREPLKEIVSRKCEYVTDPPTATRIAMVHAELGIPMGEDVPMLITSLVQEFISIEPDSELDTLADHDTVLTLRESILRDILGTWRVFCCPPEFLSSIMRFRRGEGLKASANLTWPPDQFHFPLIPERSYGSYQKAEAGEIDTMLLKLFPRVISPAVRAKLRPAVIATYALLTDPDVTNEAIHGEATYFLRTVGRALGSGRLGMDYVQKVLKGYPDLCEYVLRRWHSMSFPSESHAPSRIPLADRAGHVTVRLKNPASTMDMHHRRLSRALEFKDIDEAKERWEIFRASHGASENMESNETLRGQFDYFIYVFMSLRAPALAMDVWNHMISIKIKPSIKTWTSMLQGCKYTGKAAAIDNVWRKLILSGTHPDAYAWTARISGLASCGAHSEAIAALDQMFALWESDDRMCWAVKPTIAQLNAVLSALAGNNRIEESKRLIEWAKQKDLTPDVYTYNVLIDIAVRHGELGDVSRVLGEMTEAGIEPNEATVTLVFGNLLRMEALDTPSEQSKKVMGMLDQMEKCGMKPNKEVYGKVIYLMLKHGTSGEPIVKELLSRLAANGLTRSPHIYAMLVDYYFSRTPPDINAVDSLIMTRQLGIDRPLRADRVFWERVIKGYAECGRLKDALKVWDDLVDAPGSSALEMPVTLNVAASLLQALASHHDAQNAERIVDTMAEWASRYRAMNSLDHRRFWRHNFWYHAQKYGLLKGVGQKLWQRTHPVRTHKPRLF